MSEEVRCLICESETELIDIVDEQHTKVYRCKVFDDHISYVLVEGEK